MKILKIFGNIKQKFKNLSKTKKIIFFVLLVIIGWKFYSLGKNNEIDTGFDLNQSKTAIVTKGDILETIKVLGKSKLINEQKLRFNQIGKVVKVNFSDGSKVKKGEIIAELDKTDVMNEIRQSQIELENVRSILDDLLKGGKELEITRLKNAINETKRNIENKKNTLKISKNNEENSVTRLDQDLKLAQEDLENKEKDLQELKNDLNDIGIFENDKGEYYFLINKSSFDINGIFIMADEALTNMEKFFDDSEYKDYLGFKDLNAKNKAETSYGISESRYEKMMIVFNENKNKNMSLEDLSLFLGDLDSMLILFRQAGDDNFEFLKNSVTGATLSESQLEIFKSTMSSLRSSAQSNIDAIKQYQDNLRQKQDLLRLAKNSLEKSKNDLELLKKTIPVDKENKKMELKNEEDQIKDLQVRLKEQERELQDLDKDESREIKRAKNNVITQELALNRTMKNIEKYELRAPFDGVIRKIDLRVGDNLVSDEEKFVYLENPNIIKITIDLDQSEAVKVYPKQSAMIVFDALGDKEFEGEIDEINQTPKEDQGRVSYESTLTIDKGETRIFSGMTATVVINIKEKKDILLAPVLAIDNKMAKKIVDGIIEEVFVETGISDGLNIEIISGLQEGDEILEVDYRAVDEILKPVF